MDESDSERRRYARHPIRVPLAARPRDGSPAIRSRVGDISEGGLSFTSPTPLQPGSTVDVTLPVNGHRFSMAATVTSCDALAPRGFRVGLTFVEPHQSFRLKLAEQLLRITELQRDVARERGAPVSLEEAAHLWVERYAETFADLFEGA